MKTSQLRVIDHPSEERVSSGPVPVGSYPTVASRPVAGKVTHIAVLNSHPIQYFAPLYSYLNAAPDLKVTALYLSDVSIRGAKDAGFDCNIKWDLDLLAGYNCK